MLTRVTIIEGKHRYSTYGTITVQCQFKPHCVAAPPLSQAFGHVESSRLVPRGASSSGTRPPSQPSKNEERTGTQIVGRHDIFFQHTNWDVVTHSRDEIQTNLFSTNDFFFNQSRSQRKCPSWHSSKSRNCARFTCQQNHLSLSILSLSNLVLSHHPTSSNAIPIDYHKTNILVSCLAR
jgi:hypothetical protein